MLNPSLRLSCFSTPSPLPHRPPLQPSPSAPCFRGRPLLSVLLQVRAGATLLFDSEPVLEEAETELKASAMIDAVTRSDPEPGATGSEVRSWGQIRACRGF